MERDFDRVCEILKALRRTLPLSTAVSAKIRLPQDDETLQQRIPRLIETGISFLTVHGRTIHENKTRAGACNVDRIRLAVEAAHKIDPQFPVIANGGIEHYEDVQELLQMTGACAAMSSEALLETPNIFSKSSMHLTRRELLDQQVNFAREYLHICATVTPPLPGAYGHHKGGSFSAIRGHLHRFLHRYLQEQPDLRERMVGDRSVSNILQALALVEELYERYNVMSDEELESCESSGPLSSWYRRHRKPGRRVHQRESKAVSALSLYADLKEQSVNDRKRLIRERIAGLKERKEEKEKTTGQATRLP
jgi:tRNA-dihydrouridine synthase